jgi:hypothetical protein
MSTVTDTTLEFKSQVKALLKKNQFAQAKKLALE